ncbi:MAG: methyl-accepting chemotaxis protein [Burkholderiaceae bacterium]
MNRLSHLTLGSKLGGGFATVLLLTLLVSGLGVYEMKSISASTEEIATNWLPAIKYLAQMRAASNQVRRAEADHVMSVDAKEMESIEKTLGEARARLDKAEAEYAKLVVQGDESRRYEQFKQEKAAYFAVHEKLVALSRGGEKTVAQTQALFRGESRERFNAAMASVGALVDINDRGSNASWTSAQATYSGARNLMIGLAAVAVVLGAVLALLITRGVVRQLGGEPGQAADLARAVADGDLTARIELRAGDTASMMAALKGMQASLTDVVSKVRANSEMVATASGQIAQGTMDLSSRTEEQASALEETSASMQQLGQTVRQNADNARQANQLAQSATSVAVKGGEVVGQVVQTMSGINDSSKKIADIIGVIDGIAFQTNILALNAAVEAARAGEQGRGFAVVASEVRNLAQRSAQAAKEIKALIGDSVERVQAGSTLVAQAGETMQEVVTSIRRVTDLMGEISSASVEQSASVQQVVDAVTQMDQVTQQNAALVEESAAAAASMKEQAGQLVQTVAVFKLSSGDASRLAAAGAPAAVTVERRGPDRAKNVVRPSFGASAKPAAPRAAPAAPAPAPAPAAHAAAPAAAAGKTGTDDWESF